MTEPYDFAAAARRRAGEYADLEVPSAQDPLDQAVADTLVRPFYMTSLTRKFTQFRDSYFAVASQIDDSLIADLLSWLNWRPRVTGAYFAAIQVRTGFCTQIGRLLLRSDLCYAGKGYAIALARFNTDESIDFLEKYLDHYLNRPDLHFDQGDVFGALVHTDKLNGTSVHEAYLSTWERFIADKPHWSLESTIARFDANISAIAQIADEAR